MLQTCYFGHFRYVWLWPPKRWYQLAKNLNVYLHTKNQINLQLSWNIARILQTCYFVYFGHVWPCPQYQLLGHFDVYLHAENQLCLSFLSWDINLICRAFWSITWEPESCQTRGLCWNINKMIFHFRLFLGKNKS